MRGDYYIWLDPEQLVETLAAVPERAVSLELWVCFPSFPCVLAGQPTEFLRQFASWIH
jgi:hypothetical protein